MAGKLTASVPPSLAGTRFDVALASLSGLTRSQAKTLIQVGGASLAGRESDAAQRVEAGDEICWLPPEPVHLHAQAQPLPLGIVFEDAHLLVVDKPRGQVVHPAAGHPGGTLVNAVLHHVGQLPGEAVRPGIVHRLDRDTSGLLLVAKSEQAFRRLQVMIAQREVHRIYDAIVHGAPREERGTIDAPIGRHPRDRKRLAVVSGGRQAVTHFSVRRRLGRESWLRLRLETGRTHQIRVHLSARGWPVVGDPVYGPKAGASGQLLHAVRLGLDHPVTGEPLRFFAPWPQDMLRHLQALLRAAGIHPEEVEREIESPDPE